MLEIADWAAGTDACEGLLIATVESPPPAPYAGEGSDALEMSATDEGGAGFCAIFPHSREQYERKNAKKPWGTDPEGSS